MSDRRFPAVGDSSRTLFFNYVLRTILGIMGLFCIFSTAPVGASTDVCQPPGFIATGAPPLVMLVVGRDHKLYAEAYNDASDLNNDGILDIYYNPSLDYYGYFDSYKCYAYNSSDNRFDPFAKTSDKKCTGTNSGKWSGDFLNYVTMSRIDCLRKALFGGYRATDTAIPAGDAQTLTVLQRSYVETDVHCWGKAYESVTRDGYDISEYTPYSIPTAGNRHLFANVSLSDNGTPLLRVLTNSPYPIWQWVSKEQPDAINVIWNNSGSNVAVTPTDFQVRVQVCDPAMPEINCASYPGGVYKPTGLLQKYGESGRMQFGLLTGSYEKNHSGGVLRKNIGPITDEIDANTGKFTTVNGIIQTFQKLRIIEYDYSRHDYGAGSWVYSRTVRQGECCTIWGNPIAEMMYETLKYFANAGSTSQFVYTYGTAKDTTILGLPAPAWQDPYATIDAPCAKPIMLVISDINPSYDTDQLPGSYFPIDDSNIVGAPPQYFTDTFGTLNVNTLANTLAANENIAGSHFIGQSGAGFDTACSAKDVTGFGEIRGLCPEEPTKQGGYYSSAVSYYGHTNDISPTATGKQSVDSYVVALASPLPRIEINVGGKTVTLVPLAKSIKGSIGGGISPARGSFQPTCQIADFYVENITPISGTFRVNFEHAEQGTDYDMDAIVKYNYVVNADNSLTVVLDSSFVGGSTVQHLGYIISGTTHDGVYLEVRSEDASTVSCSTPPVNSAGCDPDYYLDTPSGALPNTGPADMSWQDGQALPLHAVRTFYASSTPAATLLHDPLWYAAKWGGFTDLNNNNIPDQAMEWNKSGDGTPDNYFLVTNPLKLVQQLDTAFAAILGRSGTAGAVATVTQNVQGQDTVVRGAFTTYDEDDPNTYVWRGRLESYWPYAGCSSYADKTGCEKGSGCRWLPRCTYSNSLLSTCSSSTSQSSCEQTGGCKWSDSRCTPTCSDIASQNACSAVAGCSWETDSCTPICSDYGSQNECGQVPGCQWANNGCTADSSLFSVCSNSLDQSTCEAESSCKWTFASHCSGTLYSFEKPENLNHFCTEHHDHCWEAEETMPSASLRNIITLINGTQRQLESNAVCTAADWLSLNGDAEFNSSDCTQLVDWIRGASWSKARDRKGWILGDIVYSTPIVVQAPSLGEIAESAWGDCGTSVGSPCSDGCDSCSEDCSKKCFSCFRECQKHRKKIIYVGANDGMLHAFVAGVWWSDPNASPTTDESHWIYDPNESDASCGGQYCTGKEQIGKELWAFVPTNLLSGLKELARKEYGKHGACQHRFMVDLSPQAWNVFIDPDGSGSRQWRTVLIGGERSGGDLYFAIDVTDPDAPKVLWEYSAFRNLVQAFKNDSGNFQAGRPYARKDIYEQVKTLPMSWSVPYVGKLNIPDEVGFLAANPIFTWDQGAPALSLSVRHRDDLSGWLAVIGGGPRIYTTDDLPDVPTTEIPSNVASSTQKLATLQSSLLMIDIEKGVNILQYHWPLLQAVFAQLSESQNWPTKTSGGNYIPYSMANPTVLDIWDSNGDQASDGSLDHIYVGDLNGQFYSLRFNMDTSDTKGMVMDVRQTQPIPSDRLTTDSYRSDRQPITVEPVAAFDTDANLRVYFGTGKFENVQGTANDKTETTKMSFYNLTESGQPPTVSPGGSVTRISDNPTIFSVSGNLSAGFTMEGFGTQVNFQCSNSSFTPPCTWTKSDGSEDCCESTCNTGISCWSCVNDLNFDGERLVDSALVAGGLVFFTTFVPRNDYCSIGGYAYFYVLDYLCGNLSPDPLRDAGFQFVSSIAGLSQTSQYTAIHDSTNTHVTGYVAMLGVGMPSRPVLDSSGQYVLVQTSDATIHKIRVALPMSPMQLKGWQQDPN